MPAADVRAAFRLSERTLFDWDTRGWLTPVRIGRQKFYRTADVARIAEQGTTRKARRNNY